MLTGIGPVGVRQPRGSSGGPGRAGSGQVLDLPPYARRSKSLEVLIPILYLKGISTGDFAEALSALVGEEVPGLSSSTIVRLKQVWSEDHARWRKRDLSAKRYVYLWADGIHLEGRLEDQAQCILVLIGATPEGKKELVGFMPGCVRGALVARPAAGSETAGPLGCARDRCGGWALGFWKALGEVWPTTRENGAGCTRLPMSSTGFPRAFTPKPNPRCRISGWPRRKRMP